MSFPAMRGYCRLILVRDGKSEVPQRILENKNLSCSLSVQHFLQGVSAAEPRFQLALWQSLLTWSTDENCCYHTQPVIQQTPYNFFKQPLVYQYKFFRSQLKLPQWPKDTISVLTMTSSPLGWKTPLMVMLNLSNLWMACADLTSQRTPSFRTRSSVGLKVAQFFL